MILQNLSKAIREQNYYAVVLEFVIVIAGVVVGFQINAWAEGRVESTRALDLIERIEEEFRTFETNLAEAERQHNVYESSTENVIAVIRDGTADTTDPQRMMEWLGMMRHVGRPPTRSAVFAEMIASGELSLLPKELRTALSQFDQSIQRNAYLWPEAASHLTGSTAIFDAVEYTSLRAPTRVLSYDPDLLALAESDLEALVIYQGALSYTFDQMSQSAREILALAQAAKAQV